ncbi:MAG: hypothetical protein M3Z75_18530 [Actinomycetota bacterium]|nr:hypothetical protein [Actinomycetota bacterium]
MKAGGWLFPDRRGLAHNLGGADPVLTLHGRRTGAVPADLPRFDRGQSVLPRSGRPGVLAAGQ